MSRRAFFLAIAMVNMRLLGCSSGGPELADVTGVVKLDGVPLPNALLLYIPQNGRTSFGRTDSHGQYRLYLTDTRAGALPGMHTIRISTRIKADPANGTHGSPELLPASYNVKSDLQQTIAAGPNVVDFDLVSGRAKIDQPND